MICPNCGEKASGRFCSSCGARLVTEAEYEDDMIRQVEKGLAATVREESIREPRVPVREEVRRDVREERYEDEDAYEDEYEDEYEDGDAGHFEEEAEPGHRVPGSLTRAVSRGVSRVWDVICTGLRLVTAVLMLASAFYMAWGFLAHIRSAGGGTADGRMAYLGCGAGLVLWAVLQTFWILKRSRRKYGREVRYVDRGHGIFTFLLFLLLYLASAVVLAFLPDHGPVSAGIGDALTVLSDLGEAFLAIQFMGLILSVLRRVCGSGFH